MALFFSSFEKNGSLFSIVFNLQNKRNNFNCAQSSIHHLFVSTAAVLFLFGWAVIIRKRKLMRFKQGNSTLKADLKPAQQKSHRQESTKQAGTNKQTITKQHTHTPHTHTYTNKTKKGFCYTEKLLCGTWAPQSQGHPQG